MSRRLFGVGLLLMAVVAWTAVSSFPLRAQEKKPTSPRANIIDSATLPPGEFMGILKTLPGSNRQFTVEIDLRRLVPILGTGRVPFIAPPPPNLAKVQQAQQRGTQAQQKGSQAQQRGSQAQQRITQARQKIAQGKKGSTSAQSELSKAQSDYNKAQSDYNKAKADYNKAQADYQSAVAQANAQATKATAIPSGVRVEITKKTIEFQAAEPVQVRTAILPEDFDEKGNYKKYTKAELVELKGKDKHLFGYESSLDKLEVGQVVYVFLLARPEPAKKPADKEAKDAKKADPGKKMQATRIIILADPKPADPPPKKKKKK